MNQRKSYELLINWALNDIIHSENKSQIHMVTPDMMMNSLASITQDANQAASAQAYFNLILQSHGYIFTSHQIDLYYDLLNTKAKYRNHTQKNPIGINDYEYYRYDTQATNTTYPWAQMGWNAIKTEWDKIVKMSITQLTINQLLLKCCGELQINYAMVDPYADANKLHSEISIMVKDLQIDSETIWHQLINKSQEYPISYNMNNAQFYQNYVTRYNIPLQKPTGQHKLIGIYDLNQLTMLTWDQLMMLIVSFGRD